jgi:hypothetical protein
VVLWFTCLLVVLVLFSLALGGMMTRFRDQLWPTFLIIFRVASIAAVPVGCLYIPWVIKLPDAERLRWLKLIGVGAVIGPLAMVAAGVVATIAGRDPYMVFVGDGLEPGVVVLWPHAFVVGVSTSALYVAALKTARHLRVSA